MIEVDPRGTNRIAELINRAPSVCLDERAQEGGIALEGPGHSLGEVLPLLRRFLGAHEISDIFAAVRRGENSQRVKRRQRGGFGGRLVFS